MFTALLFAFHTNAFFVTFEVFPATFSIVCSSQVNSNYIIAIMGMIGLIYLLFVVPFSRNSNKLKKDKKFDVIVLKTKDDDAQTLAGYLIDSNNEELQDISLMHPTTNRELEFVRPVDIIYTWQFRFLFISQVSVALYGFTCLVSLCSLMMSQEFTE
jgi:hypothetical protein